MVKGTDINCARCGRPFIKDKIYKYILANIGRKFIRFENFVSLCPLCRIEVFARDLLGSDLKFLPGNRTVAGRRRTPLQPVRFDSRTGATVYKSECFICNSGCDAAVFVKDGKVIKVEGDTSSPVTKGILCSKGLASRHMLYHPDRLMYPMKRRGKRGEGRWKRITWNEALATISDRFRKIEEEYGKEAIVLAQGTAKGWLSYFARFSNALRSPYIGPGAAQCAIPRMTASKLVTGDVAVDCPDYEQTACMLVWGANPPSTWPLKALGMMEAKTRGAKLIVVDPVMSETASKADIWLQLRPGTDAALALGMLKVIIDERLFDQRFVDEWSVGFEELKDRVQKYSPEIVERITWVPKEKMVKAARMFAELKPASITVCVAVEQNADTISTCRSIIMLSAITGNVDVPGGNIFPSSKNIRHHMDPKVTLTDNLSKEDWEKVIGYHEFPFLSSEHMLTAFPHPHHTLVWKAILTGVPHPVRAIYCHGSNMLVAYGNSNMVKQALVSLDFLVVADLYMTPTAELADIVLPAATWMERDAVSMGHQISYNKVVHLQQKCVEIGECWTDYRILNELAKKLGVDNLMFGSEEEYCDYLLEPFGISFKEFKKKGALTFTKKYRSYLEKGFGTPSGKVEFYSKKLKELGFDPLPDYREPEESPVSVPQLAEKYPLILTTGGRVPVFRHSELRNIQILREIVPDLYAFINPETAKKIGVGEGDTLVVETPRGSMEAKAHLTLGIDPRVIQVPSHWPGKNNVNLITDNDSCAPMVGSNPLRCQLCNVRKKQK